MRALEGAITAIARHVKGTVSLHPPTCGLGSKPFVRHHADEADTTSPCLIPMDGRLHGIYNDKGLAPWLMAAGCGGVDTAMALSQAGCDVFAKTPADTNAADRRSKSSTQMLTYLIQ